VPEAAAQLQLIDARLAARVRAGDASAESDLMRRFMRPVLAVAQHRMGHAENAWDVVQETLIVVLERLRRGEIEDPTRLAGFVRQTAVNVALGLLRKQRRQRTDTAGDDLFVIADECANPFAKLERAEIVALVHDLVEEMPVERDRMLLWRHYVLDEDKAALCGEFALSDEHFDRVLHRARSRLRAIAESRRASLR